jgi:hypothetical protein
MDPSGGEIVTEIHVNDDSFENTIFKQANPNNQNRSDVNNVVDPESQEPQHFCLS